MGAIPEMMITRLSAWHRAGNVLGEYFDIQTLLADANLNENIVKRQLESNGIKVPAWGTFGEDTGDFKGVVGEEYQVLQHTEGFKLLNDLIGNGAKRFETAGTLFGGRTYFASVALDKTLRVGDDESTNFLNFVTSHDGRFAFSVKLASNRQVCENTILMSLSQTGTAGFKVYHTKNALLEFQNAKQAMESVEQDIEKVEENLNFLASRMVTDETMKDVMEELFLKKTAKGKDKMTTGSKRAETVFTNKLEEILDRYESNDRNAFPEQRGTAYNLLNAITGYVDHGKDNRSFEYATLGTGNDLKSRALEVITLSANGMPEKAQTRYFSVGKSEPLPTMDNQDVVAELLGL
ncbi:LGT_TIGR03299, phage/plasmid-like protein TIGR03299 [uncultured Caudovirales phage]|uniref:LGT_TIGR03299, phage/plasmid-like protein TIGR03299 n=1 Tax=uncultured Caudovirales phage TaxID=2100421 RepID=A0A6J5MDK0_9CAUD|nr:LGT_TIGR03299, phage/plasmid-like protein TIGR03299 [uncultured Caudovirales phage]